VSAEIAPETSAGIRPTRRHDAQVTIQEDHGLANSRHEGEHQAVAEIGIRQRSRIGRHNLQIDLDLRFADSDSDGDLRIVLIPQALRAVRSAMPQQEMNNLVST
jgi:hypothetical protein